MREDDDYKFKRDVNMKLEAEKGIHGILSNFVFLLFLFFMTFAVLITVFVEASVDNPFVFLGFMPVAFFYIGGFLWLIEQLDDWRKSIKKKEYKILEAKYCENMKELPTGVLN